MPPLAMESPDTDDCGAIAQLVAPGVMARLLQDGWADVEQVFSAPFAATLATESMELDRAGLLEPHTFQFRKGAEAVDTFTHPGRTFVDMDVCAAPDAVCAHAPAFAHLAAVRAVQMARALASAVPDLKINTGSQDVQVKLQQSHGEHGCAPWHFDTSETAASRQLTLLVYLAQDWDAADGGELELLPFLSTPVLLTPWFNRGVLFLSDRVLHRSRCAANTSKRRWLLTVWFDGAETDYSLAGRWPPPPLQRYLAPAVYREDYLEALEDSLPPGPARAALLHAQALEIRELQQDPDFAEIVQELRAVAKDARGAPRTPTGDGPPVPTEHGPPAPRRKLPRRARMAPGQQDAVGSAGLHGEQQAATSTLSARSTRQR